MNAIYGLYPDGAAAQEAVDRLRATGLADREITILSAQPMEDYEFGHIDRQTSIWWIASLGGLIGAALAVLYAWVAATTWPMNVGGLPVISWWSAGVITFEMTMLGAIVGAVLTLIVSAELGRGGNRLYDPAVSDGAILVGVESPPASRIGEIERALGYLGDGTRDSGLGTR